MEQLANWSSYDGAVTLNQSVCHMSENELHDISVRCSGSELRTALNCALHKLTINS